MKCCFFKSGMITEINENIYPNLVYITISPNPNDIYSSTVLIVSDSTVIVDENYNEINVNNLQVGDLVYVYHSPIMTMSLPPQTNAFIIVLK